MTWQRKIVGVAAAAAAGLGLAMAPETVTAQEGFYAGKTLKVVIRSGPGGGNDFYGRLLARHMPRHIPGNPDTIPVNMPGGGGIVAANYLTNRAKRDGSEIAILSRALAIVQRSKATGVKYDVRKLIPLGSPASSTAVLLLAKDHPVNDLGEIKARGETVRMSTTGPGGGAYQRSMVLKLDGYPMDVVTGYVGTDEKVLAVVRGEVHGTAGSYESMRTAIREEGLKPIAYLGSPHPELDPKLNDMRQYLSPNGRALASLLAAPLEAGRPFFTAPGVPADRVAVLRAAFKKAVQDPALLAEAKKAGRDISYTDPKQMEATYKDILDASDEVMAQFKKLM